MRREIKWCGKTQEAFSAFPAGAKRQLAAKLQFVAAGVPFSGLKSWNGCGPGGCEFASSGYRVVLTKEFSDAIWVLNAFPKDSNKGRKRDTDLAVKHYKEVVNSYASRSTKH